MNWRRTILDLILRETGFARFAGSLSALFCETTLTTKSNSPEIRHDALQQDFPVLLLLDGIFETGSLHREAKASAPTSSLVDKTALLKEIRVSTSVGGGGRERQSLEGKRPAKAGSGNSGDAADELGTRRSVTPKVARYQEHVGPALKRSAERRAKLGAGKGCDKAELPQRPQTQSGPGLPGPLFLCPMQARAATSKHRDPNRKRLICRRKPTRHRVVIGTESLFCPARCGTKKARPRLGRGHESYCSHIGALRRVHSGAGRRRRHRRRGGVIRQRSGRACFRQCRRRPPESRRRVGLSADRRRLARSRTRGRRERIRTRRLGASDSGFRERYGGVRCSGRQ